MDFVQLILGPLVTAALSHLDGLVPYDGVPIEETVTVNVSLTVIYTLMATAGIIFTIICLGFNFIFRDRKCVLSPSVVRPFHVNNLFSGSTEVVNNYAPYSARMSPKIVHELMRFCMEVLVLGDILSTWFLLKLLRHVYIVGSL